VGSDRYNENNKPLLILGDIPRSYSDRVEIYAPVIVHYKGVHGHLGKITQGGICDEIDYRWDNIQPGDGIKDFQIVSCLSSTPDLAVYYALRTALGARFEHGENPQKIASYGVHPK
jgi:hypothetical protein